MRLATVIIEAIGVLTSASTLFVVAAGLTLVFGALRLINIAHGSFYAYGALIATTIIAAATGAGFWLALVAAPLCVAAIGVVVEAAVLRRTYAREHLTQLLATFALFLIFGDIALRLWGTASRTVSPPAALTGQLALAGATVPEYDFVVIGVAVLTGTGLWLLLSWTALGWRIRAAVADPETLAAGGTNLRALRTGVFALGSALAGLAGAVIAPLQAVGPGLDSQIIVAAFIVAVVGGLGSVPGAALGALIIGLFETLGTLWVPAWAPVSIYVVMIIVLAVRPSGLLGAPER